MDNKYSFIDIPAINILMDSISLCPGIEKVITLYYNYNNNSPEVKSISINKEKYLIENLNIENEIELIKTLRKNINISWYSEEELPFYLKNKYSIKPDVFSEYDKRILTLCYPDNREYNFLFYFFFKKNTSDFNLANNNKILTTENKSIIGTLLYNSIKTTIQNNKKNLKILNIINNNSESVQKNNYQIKKELEKSKTSLKKCLIDLSEVYFSKFSKKYNKKYILTEEAKNKISLYNGDVSYLESIIEKAVIIINNTYFKDSDNIIKVLDWHINFNIQDSNDEIQEQTAIIEDKYQKPKIFLKNLEIAAGKVTSNNKKLTSENIGKAFPIPITNAAISQKLKKYRNSIINILDENPDNYPIIQEKFKPLRKIIQFKKENSRLDKYIA